MRRTAFFIFLLALFPLHLIAGHGSESEEFKVDEYIMEHVLDSYGWHITELFGKDITIPLPIILFDHGKLVCFSSSQFHHGTAAYKGYALGFTKDTEGKIVKLQDDYANFTGTLDPDKAYSWNKSFFDISISKNVCAIWISIFLLCGILLSVARTYKKHPTRAPKGLQNMIEVVVLFIKDEIAIPMIGKDRYQKYLPYLLTLFFFILVNNLFGLIPFFPGGANVTGNIAVTLVLALITFFVVQFSSNKTYWKHIINTPGVPWLLKFPIPIMPVIEIFGLITKPFVLMIRLFANVLAGHIVILGFLALIFIFGAIKPLFGLSVAPISILFYIFMGLLELLVAFIQAYIFTILTALYIGMAKEH